MILKVFTIVGIVSALVLGSSNCTEGAGSTQEKNVPDIKILKIRHYKVPCQGEGFYLCYQVENEEGAWEYMYDEIAGFDYLWGYDYTVKVRVDSVKNPPMDASALSYTLLEIIDKKQVARDEVFSIPLQLNGESLLTSESGCKLINEVEIELTGSTCEQISQFNMGTFSHSEKTNTLLFIKGE